jgi:hypothetical protein
MDWHHTDACRTIDHDAAGEIEVEFLLAGVEQDVVRVACGQVFVLHLERHGLLLWSVGWGGVFVRHGAGVVASLPDNATADEQKPCGHWIPNFRLGNCAEIWTLARDTPMRRAIFALVALLLLGLGLIRLGQMLLSDASGSRPVEHE